MGAAAGKRLVLPSSPNLGKPFGEFRFKRKVTTEEDAAGCGGSNTTYLPSRTISGSGANAYCSRSLWNDLRLAALP